MTYPIKKITMVLLASLLSICVMAQGEVKIFAQNKNPGYVLYAGNVAFCPVSIFLELDLENLRFTGSTKKAIVVPARTDSFRIGELEIIDTRARNKYGFRSKFQIGDLSLQTADTSYVYDLPFAPGKNFMLFQGYNGNFSHQNEKALDFTMPEGTEIFAARDGVVVRVIQENNQSCATEDCKKYNNAVTLYHADGSFTTYAHIRYNGSKVKVGDLVKKGSAIAYSGNTGWSSGPHLHFMSYLPGLEKPRTLATKFRIGDGSIVGYLKEKQLYMKGY
ncbi:MAG: M23 family metallopeptidase [Sediminibacterium sp.]